MREWTIERLKPRKGGPKNWRTLSNWVKKSISTCSKWFPRANKTSISTNCSQMLSKPQSCLQLMIVLNRIYKLMISDSSINSIKPQMIWWRITIGAKIPIKGKKRIRTKHWNLRNSSLKQGLLWKKSLRRIRHFLSSIIGELLQREMQSSASKLWNSLRKFYTFFRTPMASQRKFQKWQVFICSRVVHREKSQSLIPFRKLVVNICT